MFRRLDKILDAVLYQWRRHFTPPSCLPPQETLRLYLHHLQQRRKDGYYVYMFSERQASEMMPSLRDAPHGMTYQQFLNVMYHVHQSTGVFR